MNFVADLECSAIVDASNSLSPGVRPWSLTIATRSMIQVHQVMQESPDVGLLNCLPFSILFDSAAGDVHSRVVADFTAEDGIRKP